MQTEAGGKITLHNNPGSVELAVFDGGSSRAYLTLTLKEATELSRQLDAAFHDAVNKEIEELRRKNALDALKGAANA